MGKEKIKVEQLLPPMTFNEFREFLKADLYRHTGETSWRHLLKHVLFSDGGERFSDGVKYVFYLRLCRYLKTERPRVIFWPLYRIAMRRFIRYKYKFGCSIPHSTSIGRGLYIGHIRDIVINELSVIGDNCNISQGVTIGQSNRGRRKGTPVIGRNVYIGPGAKIVGAVHVGDHVAIGANCVVTDDVPDYAVVVGVPGRVISFDGSAGYVNRTDYLGGDETGNQRAPSLSPMDEMVSASAMKRSGTVSSRDEESRAQEVRDRAGIRHCGQ
ncbi:MAG TPA: serine O-acetyltransferase [Nitrospira sp.]|nr:serine O-acetyltransferase [Nitrospira sp.]